MKLENKKTRLLRRDGGGCAANKILSGFEVAR